MLYPFRDDMRAKVYERLAEAKQINLDQGILPNEQAKDYADRLLIQEMHDTLVPVMRNIVQRAYMAGWSAAMDTRERLQAETPLTPTGIDQLAAAVTPLIRKIVNDAFEMHGSAPKLPKIDPYSFGSTLPGLPDGYSYLMHSKGEYPCHKPAYILTRQIQEGEIANRDVFRYLSGMPIPADARSTCGSCLREVHPYSNADLDWTPHIIRTTLRTVAGHFVSEDEPTGASVSPDAGGSGDYGFPMVPDPQFNVESGNDIPEPHAPGEFSALEMQEILKLKAETDAALSTNLWLDEPDGRTSVSGS